jgi:hypothetical protein
MQNKSMEAAVRQRFAKLKTALNERQRRLWAAAEARSVGYGGVSLVHRATRISRRAIHAGLKELATKRDALPLERVRRPGAGRLKLTQTQAGLAEALDALVEPTARGDPQSTLRWTCKSLRHLAQELRKQRFRISHQTVADLLHAADYSLQANRKTLEGCNQPDRNAQFHFINQQVKAFQRRGQPVISIDTKKKELIGNYRNGGREWRPQGKPLPVKAHDFKDKKLGKGIPYGVFDMTHNEAWVSVGIDHDTAEFAAATILQWWQKMGAKRFSHATEILITADSGGSNGSRSRLWKVALQSVADCTGLKVTVAHFPPGTSKWNKIEHRLFCHITQNWRGQPLVSHEIMVKLIGRTTTRQGLKVKSALDRHSYPAGKKVSDDELAQVNLRRAKFHGDWNYSVIPSKRKKL